MPVVSEDNTKALTIRGLPAEGVIKSFPDSLKTLRVQLSNLSPSYQDVKLSQLAKDGQWWLDEENRLVGKSWLFGLLVQDSNRIPDEVTMVWTGNAWEPADELQEIHINAPQLEPHTFGGAEPVPGDKSGKSQHAPTTMTMESIRALIREALLEVK